MDVVAFVVGFGLFSLAFYLAPTSRDDRPGLLRYIPEDASKKTERRFRLANTMMWLTCLFLGLVLLLFGLLE